MILVCVCAYARILWSLTFDVWQWRSARGEESVKTSSTFHSSLGADCWFITLIQWVICRQYDKKISFSSSFLRDLTRRAIKSVNHKIEIRNKMKKEDGNRAEIINKISFAIFLSFFFRTLNPLAVSENWKTSSAHFFSFFFHLLFSVFSSSHCEKSLRNLVEWVLEINLMKISTWLNAMEN